MIVVVQVQVQVQVVQVQVYFNLNLNFFPMINKFKKINKFEVVAKAEIRGGLGLGFLKIPSYFGLGPQPSAEDCGACRRTQNNFGFSKTLTPTPIFLINFEENIVLEADIIIIF